MTLRHGVLLLGLVCAPLAQADPLSDLTARLKSLQADSEVKGVLDASYEQFDAKGVADKDKSAHLQLDIDANGGLSIHLSPTLTQALSAEEARNATDSDAPTPQADLLRQMNPTHLQHMLSVADTLLRNMDGGTSKGAKPASLDGTAVTQLTLSLPFRAPKKDSDAAKDWQDTLDIWVDAQGVPLRYEDKVHGKFCKFFLCVTVDETHVATLRVLAGRLVTVAETLEHQQAGLGQDNHTKTVSMLQLQ